MNDNGNSVSENNKPDSPALVPSISVFFPCHNEVDNIKPLVEKTLYILSKLTCDFEIIIVDDGSGDGTDKVADLLAADSEHVKVVRHPTNSGYGAALQSGFKAATKELVFYTDGDGQFDITEMPALLPMTRQYDIVSCYRLNRQEGAIRKINAWAWTKLVCFIFGMKLKDIDCAFKLFKRSIFDDITIHSTGALIDTEILARAIRKGYTITQTGVHHYPRQTGTQSGAKISVIFRAFKELFELRKDILRKS
ncbi:MAG: glycosyltransferase family 2 protein [Planctomycetota bacterium]|jgi:glycosyltransferase involved in cell wall biosynthesis